MIEPIPRPFAHPDRPAYAWDGQPIRAIATDIDGTITDMRRLLDWDAVTALREAESLGVPVLFATGNVIPVSKTFGHCIGTTAPHVCENGGTLYWELPGKNGASIMALEEVLYDRRPADRIVEELVNRGHHPRYISSDPWRMSEAALELGSVDEAVVRAVTEELDQDLYVVATGFACHILPIGMNKSSGIAFAMDWMNQHDPRFAPDHPDAHPDARPLERHELLAIGDSTNDLEMIEDAGLGVAVANAPPAVKAKAKLVTKAPHGAGVKEALDLIRTKRRR